MNDSLARLYYIHDPMCSWCWGFRPVWNQIQDKLAGKVSIQYVLGGLAQDTDKAMPENMQIKIRDNWKRIQQDIPGIEFNYDFWSECQPRRSTYPSCRAVIACRMQQPELEKKMILAIQLAYYLEARNPSDDAVLIQLAKDIGLNADIFSLDLNSDACQRDFESELLLTKKLRVSSFPSLVLSKQQSISEINIDYKKSDNVINQIF